MGVLLIVEGACVVRHLPISFVALFDRWSSLRENVVFYFGVCCTIVGAVLLLKAIAGIVSVGDRVKRCCLLQFWLLTCACIVVAVVLSVYLIVSMPRIREEVEHRWNSSLTSYSSDEDSKEIIDFVQQLFECCGLRSRTDWKFSSFHNRSEHNYAYPSSCCYGKTCKNSTVFSQGCSENFDSFVFVRTVLYGVTVPLFTILEILCLIASTILIACPPNPGYQEIIEEEEDGCCLCQRKSNGNVSKDIITPAVTD